MRADVQGAADLGGIGGEPAGADMQIRAQHVHGAAPRAVAAHHATRRIEDEQIGARHRGCGGPGGHERSNDRKGLSCGLDQNPLQILGELRVLREEHDVKAGTRTDAIEEIVIGAELHVASGLADGDAVGERGVGLRKTVECGEMIVVRARGAPMQQILGKILRQR